MKGLTLVLVGAMLSIAMLPSPAMAVGSCTSPQANIPAGPAGDPHVEAVSRGESNWYAAPGRVTVQIYQLTGMVDARVHGPCGVLHPNRCLELLHPPYLECDLRLGERLEISYVHSWADLSSVTYILRRA